MEKRVDILDKKSLHVTSRVINIFIRSGKYKENDLDFCIIIAAVSTVTLCADPEAWISAYNVKR